MAIPMKPNRLYGEGDESGVCSRWTTLQSIERLDKKRIMPENKETLRIEVYKEQTASWKHEDNTLQKDRQQSRELQLKSWLVLRFSDSEILYDTDAIAFTIHRAIKQKLVQKANRQTFAAVNRRWMTKKETQEDGSWWGFVGTLTMAFVVIILIDYSFNVF